MNKKLIIGIATAAAAALYFLKGKKQALEDIKFSPKDIAINSSKSNLMQLVYNFKVLIKNDNKLPVNITSINLDIAVNNKLVSNFQTTQTINIPGETSKLITFQISINNLAAVDVILATIANNTGINIKITGDVITDLGVLNINYSKNL
jgi:LEA14-like dessication related protein